MKFVAVCQYKDSQSTIRYTSKPYKDYYKAKKDLQNQMKLLQNSESIIEFSFVVAQEEQKDIEKIFNKRIKSVSKTLKKLREEG